MTTQTNNTYTCIYAGAGGCQIKHQFPNSADQRVSWREHPVKRDQNEPYRFERGIPFTEQMGG